MDKINKDMLAVASILGGCDTCEHKQTNDPKDGYCYMFADAPEGNNCAQYVPVEITSERLQEIGIEGVDK